MFARDLLASDNPELVPSKMLAMTAIVLAAEKENSDASGSVLVNPNFAVPANHRSDTPLLDTHSLVVDCNDRMSQQEIFVYYPGGPLELHSQDATAQIQSFIVQLNEGTNTLSRYPHS